MQCLNSKFFFKHIWCGYNCYFHANQLLNKCIISHFIRRNVCTKCHQCLVQWSYHIGYWKKLIFINLLFIFMQISCFKCVVRNCHFLHCWYVKIKVINKRHTYVWHGYFKLLFGWTMSAYGYFLFHSFQRKNDKTRVTSRNANLHIWLQGYCYENKTIKE